MLSKVKGHTIFSIYNQRARGATAGTVQDRNEAEMSIFGRKPAQCCKDIKFAHCNIK